MTRQRPRDEQIVFDDLRQLCATPGYAHVIAYLCLRDNFVMLYDNVSASDMEHLYSHERLIRTELTTLLGLMVQGEASWQEPPPENPEPLIKATERLLEELHQTMMLPWRIEPPSVTGAKPAVNFEAEGEAFREPIFYGGESAFSFQYCDFAPLKYGRDDEWLVAHRGASIREMATAIKAVAEIQNRKVTEGARAGPSLDGAWSPLHMLVVDARDVADQSGLSFETVSAVLRAFAIQPGERNAQFRALNDFNCVAATPLIVIAEGQYLHFQFYGLAEALYESPFYWLGADKAYAATALSNRGRFTEDFAFDRSRAVFGDAQVHRNINVERRRGQRIGEIDVLVTFADRAIVLQAKSKRLTMEARRGNDLQLKGDFKAAVQDAYNQAVTCAEVLNDPSVKLLREDGSELELASPVNQAFPICLVADHYPALNFQAEQFLTLRKVDGVTKPLVIDVFAFDAMAEMLSRPLRFISYLDLRAQFGDRMQFSHEMTLLSYHLKYNLWLSSEYDFMLLADDFGADLEIAMTARRLGTPGATTPKGILTAIEGRRVDGVLTAIERYPSAAMVDLAMLIYEISGDSLSQLADGVDTVVTSAITRGSSDFSLGFGAASAGVTIHANALLDGEAERRLEGHCLLRKYKQKATTWYGVTLQPGTGEPRFSLKLQYPWERDPVLAKAAKELRPKWTIRSNRADQLKAGRNAPCPCGSGKKYKRCCLTLPTTT